jgi:hypothetical protein
MPNTLNRGILLLTILGFAMRAEATPISGLDTNGFVRPDDAACWFTFSCSASRGGDSDVLTVYDPTGAIYAQVFAFGNEEANNTYYFDPATVPIDTTQFGKYTTLLEPDGVTWSDTFGIDSVGGREALAFISDPETNSPTPLSGRTFIEHQQIINPGPEDADSKFLTIPYDATRYLSPTFQSLGYRADFRSDVPPVPEPATLSLLALGLVGVAQRHRKNGRVPKD